jgi:acetyl-CoA C-acetyltransferase
MSRPDVVLCHPVRIAIGTYGGSLKSMPAAALGAAVVKTLLDPAKVGAVPSWAMSSRLATR